MVRGISAVKGVLGYLWNPKTSKLLSPQRTYSDFQDIYKEIIIRIPKKAGFKGLRLIWRTTLMTVV